MPLTETTPYFQDDPVLVCHPNGARVTVSLEIVGPDEARAMLKGNTHNRRAKPGVISKIVEDLTSGNFEFNGATVCFDDHETLLDGQNRLQGIVLADMAVPLLVVRGLTLRAQMEMDTGAKRNLADVLTLNGEANTASLATIIRRVAAWKVGERRGVMEWSASNSTLLRVLDSTPELRDITSTARRLATKVGLNVATAGLCLWVFEQIDADDAADFFAKYADGTGLEKGHPVYELRESLARTPVDGSHATALRHLVLTIKSWNAYRDGEPVGKLQWKAGGAQPDRFPEPR